MDKPLLPEPLIRQCSEALRRYLEDTSTPADMLSRVAEVARLLRDLHEPCATPKDSVRFMIDMNQLVWDMALVQDQLPTAFPPMAPPTDTDNGPHWQNWYVRSGGPSAPPQGPTVSLRIPADGEPERQCRRAIYERLGHYQESQPATTKAEWVGEVVGLGLSTEGAVGLTQQAFLRLQAAYPDLNLAWLLLGVGNASLEDTQRRYAEVFQPAQDALIAERRQAAADQQGEALSHHESEQIFNAVYDQEFRLQTHLLHRINTALACLLGEAQTQTVFTTLTVDEAL